MALTRKWMWAPAAIVAGAILAAFASRRDAPTQYVTARVQHGEIRDAVDATGTVNAVTTVQVGSQVSGTIAKLYVDFNSRVRKGQIVAQIDSSLLRGVLLQAGAALENARANVEAAKASLEKAHAMEEQTRTQYDREVSLEQQRMETTQNLDLARAAYQSSQADVHSAEAAVEQARAQVIQNEAALQVARTNLDYCIIRSPIDGTVIARNVDVGQTVAASLQAPTIFTIAQDLTKMQVYAAIDESDVGRIRLRQAVTFKVDAFPKETFTGHVSQVRMNATTIQNVVTYNAIIDFDNPDLKLFPGMTAYVSIPVATVRGAIKLPNAALRFRPGTTPDSAVQRAVVWKLRPDRTLEPVEVTLGITDHAFTEVKRVVTGTLRPGDELVTAAINVKAPSGPGGVRR